MIESSRTALPIKITVHWATRVIYVVGIAFFSLAAILSFQFIHQISLALIFGTFSFLSVYTLILSQATIDIDQESITVNSPPHGVYRMYWQEVQYVETNGNFFAFFGNDKQLIISLAYAGNGKSEFLGFFSNFIQERKLEVRPLSTMWLKQKNTKVS